VQNWSNFSGIHFWKHDIHLRRAMWSTIQPWAEKSARTQTPVYVCYPCIFYDYWLRINLIDILAKPQQKSLVRLEYAYKISAKRPKNQTFMFFDTDSTGIFRGTKFFKIFLKLMSIIRIYHAHPAIPKYWGFPCSSILTAQNWVMILLYMMIHLINVQKI
jgi:hypothetical protein